MDQEAENHEGAPSIPYPVHCRRGREQDLFDALHSADEWAWGWKELLETDIGMIRVSDLVLARHIIAESTGMGDPQGPRRLMYRWVDVPVRYTRIFVHDVTSTMREAGLISSMLDDGSHKPALDLDYPAELWEDSRGQLWLRAEPESPALDYHGHDMLYEADRAMRAIGLERKEPREHMMRSRRPQGRLMARLGENWDGSYEQLSEIAHNLAESSSLQQVPEGGVWYKVEGEAQLVPSTSWSHLYLDINLTAATYEPALRAIAGCGLLNPGFVNAIEDRRFTSLRRPGMKKPDKQPLPVDDIPF